MCRTLLLLTTLLLGSALAHEPSNLASGSLNEGAQTSVLVFVGFFALVLLLSLGGLAYTLLGSRKKGAALALGGSGTVSLAQGTAGRPHTPWAVAFGGVAALSVVVLAFGVQNYLQRQNAPIYPTAVLYPGGWQVSYGRGALEDHVTVQAGAISYLHLSSEVQGARLELPALGLRLDLPRGQKQDVQFIALRAGEYRSSRRPVLRIRSLEPAEYRRFAEGRR